MATQDPEAGRLAEQVAALRWRCLHAPADDAPHDDSPAGARTGSTAAASAAAAIIALPPPPLLPPQQPIQREPPSFGEQLFALERRWGALRKLLEAPPDIGVPGIGRGAAASPAGLLRGLLSDLFRDVEALWLDAGREPAAYSLMEAVADAAMEFETEAAVAAAARAAGVPAGGGGARGGALETASAFGVARAAALAGADGARRVILSDDLWQQWDTFAARTRAQEILSQEQAAFAAAAALEASVLDAATDACAPASPTTQATAPLRAAVPAATSHLVSADLPLPLIGAASAAVDTVAGVAVLGAASSQAIAFVGNKQAGSSSACSSSSDFTAAAHAPHAESSAQGRLDDGKAITAAPMSRRQRQREHRRLGQQQQQQSAAAIPYAAAATAAPHTAGQAVTMQQQQQQPQRPCRHGAKRRRGRRHAGQQHTGHAATALAGPAPQQGVTACLPAPVLSSDPCGSAANGDLVPVLLQQGAPQQLPPAVPTAANAAGAQLEAAARAIAGWRLQGVAKPRARVARGELQRPRDSSLRGTLLRAILRVARAAEVVTAGTIAGAALSHAFLA